MQLRNVSKLLAGIIYLELNTSEYSPIPTNKSEGGPEEIQLLFKVDQRT